MESIERKTDILWELLQRRSVMKLRINFCDMAKDFNKDDNYFVNIIKKHFEGYEISETPDFLFYSVFGTTHLKYNNCVKVFITGEAAAPDFNECDYAIGFDWITFEDRYFRRPVWMEEERFYKNYAEISDVDALERKFCNFIYFNDSKGEGTEFRKKFVQKLSEYKRVDCPGKVMNNMKANLVGRYDGDWRKGKVDFIKDYKFTIAFENTSYRGYTTEKMLHPIAAKSIPIYWGNPVVERDFNADAFINCNGYENQVDRIIEKIIEIDSNDDKYLEMLHSSPMSNTFNEKEFEDFESFILNIFNKGNVPYNKDPINFAKRMSVDSMSRKEKIRYFFLK